jgi:Fe-S-cluster containining protein
MELKPLPWSAVKSWTCSRCGECCKLIVQLTTREWLDLTRQYGSMIVDQRVGGFFLRKTVDNRCPFLRMGVKGWQCGLQRSKPLACKLWPFRVLTKPKYDQPREACYDHRDKQFYVYALPICPGISWGRPSDQLAKRTIPELIDIRLGLQTRQFFSTSS